MRWCRVGVISWLVGACAVEVDTGQAAFGSAGEGATSVTTTVGTEGGEEETSGGQSGDEGTSSTSDSGGSTSSDGSASTSSGTTGDTAGVCGDGVADEGEDCDLGDLGGETCVGLGFDGGDLACAGDCTHDTSGCYACGDGMRNGNEQCDGNDLGGTTCMQLGWDQGQLACTMSCVFDSSGCEDAPCKQKGEACSGANDCCNTGCGKGGSVCISNGQQVCCT